MLIESSKLREKEVIDLKSGKCLGFVCDLLLDTECGKICAIFVSDHIFAISGAKGTTRISWDKISCIGEDTILVDAGTEECSCNDGGRKERKRCGWLF